MVRILNILLLLIIMVGIYFVTQANTKFEVSRREHARLTAKVGRLPIWDATKVHVIALETDDPLDFAWHIYVPPNFDWQWTTSRLQHSSSRSTGKEQGARTEIVRVRFRKIDDQWHVWSKMLGSSGLTSTSDTKLLDRPELLRVEQLGVDQVRVVESDEVVTLLSITVERPSRPEDPAASVFVGRFGSRVAWAKEPRGGY